MGIEPGLVVPETQPALKGSHHLESHIISGSSLQAVSRALFRWYRSKFPLRDGKIYSYKKLHPRLMLEERQVTGGNRRSFQAKKYRYGLDMGGFWSGDNCRIIAVTDTFT